MGAVRVADAGNARVLAGLGSGGLVCSRRADEAFDRLWSADGLTWSELASISDDAALAPAP